MAHRSTPRPGQLIAAGLASALACLPIYALLSVMAFSITSATYGSNEPTVAGFLGALLVAIPFSMFGIVIWPVSVLVAASLFAVTGRLLFPHFEDHRFRLWIWIGAGAVVGLLTGIAMTWEVTWKSWYSTDNQLNFGGLAFAIPTGALGSLICRRIIRVTVRGTGHYDPNRF